ncbi:hypothetical protein [Kaistella palustris]|uniref:hypothetical protein n=1 Tax=Kaistella palustris TaxID=493376 RepID=UPI00041555EE|nr:hypothetical protein [Kaistella palustris]
MTRFELYTLIFSALVAISTVVSLILNSKLTREARLTREHKDSPDINVYLKRAEADPSFIFVVFENIGLGYAKNVKFTIIQDFNCYHHQTLNFSNKGIIKYGKDNFAPSQKFEYFLTNLSDDYKNKIEEKIIIEVFYENIFKRKYTKTLNLELKELAGQSILKPPADYIGRIAYELNEIKLILEKIQKKQ